MNDELKKLLNIIIKEKGGSYKDYRLLMDKIGYHESKSDPKAIQKGRNGKDAPGRGKYQFEVGDNKGANTAVNRTYKYMQANGIKPPQWLNDAYKNKSTDASQLKDYQQDIMFLGNMMGHPKANFKNVIDGKESIVDFWSKYHWAGKNKDLEARTKSFNESMEHYKQPEPEKQVDLMQYLTKPTVEPITSDLQGVPQQSPLLNTNQLAYGGNLNSNINQSEFNEFNEGGSHEQNKSFNGIPMGTDNQGKLNTVEQNETSFDFEDGKYIFSDRLLTNGKKRNNPLNI